MPARDGELEILYNQVGFIVIQWSHCEQSLELLANVLYQQYDGKKLTGKKRMPKALSDKLEFVKKCIVKAPSLAPFKAELEALVSSFDELSQTRHDIVHGALASMSPTNGVFTFIRLETHPDTHEVKKFLYDLSEFPAFRTKLLRLGKASVKLANLLWRERQEHQ
jgi:hypothetical protein